MKIFISIMMILFSFIMFFMNNPLSMGLMILIQTMLMCMISGMMINTYWFSYILFLTFLSGLLILFIYVSSISSNELFTYSMKKMIFTIMIMTIMTMMIMILLSEMNYMNISFNNEMINFFSMNEMFMNNENKINLSKLYNKQTYYFTMMLILYLFITLVSVIKIINIFFGPLRTSF